MAHAHPGDHRLWQMLGLLHRESGDSAPSIAAFERAAALAPADAKVLHGLAQARLDAGLPAIDAFERAVRSASDPGPALLGLAAALTAEGEIVAAVERLDAHLARNPGWAEGHWLASRLRWMSGERATYLAALDHALAAAPKTLALWQLRALIAMRATRYDAVLETVARARAAMGDQPVFRLYEAIAQSETGNAARADPLLAGLDPGGDLSTLIQLVRHDLRIGRPERAIARALPVSDGPAAPFVWPYLAVAWRLTGDPRREWLEGAQQRLVGVYDLACKLPPIETLAEHMRGLHRKSAHPLEQSVRGGTQTDGPLFMRLDPPIQALRNAIAEAVRAHIAQLPPHDPRHPQLGVRRDRPVRFAGSWSIRLEGGGHHVNHVHPEGWFSSAFYLTLPEEVAKGQAGWLALGEPEEGLGVDLPPLRLVEPKPGRLVLFPSTLWHGTRPFGEGERMTVAFDVARPRP